MDATPDPSADPEPSSVARVVLIVLIVLSILLLGFVIAPFAGAYFIAAVLAGALYPLYLRLTARLRGRRALAAGLLTGAVFLALVLPTGGITALVVKESVDGVTFVRETLSSEGVHGLIRRLPGPLQKLGDRVVSSIPSTADELNTMAGEQSSRAAAAVGGVLAATSQALVQTGMMLIALFFFLLDGRQLVTWLESLLPFRRVRLTELLVEFRGVSVSVLVSSALTAGVQAVASLIGFAIARVPNLIFFVLVAFVLAFIPAVGAASVSIVLSLLLFAGGRTGSAIFLLLYGVVVVGTVDNVAKPLLMRFGSSTEGTQLDEAVVFFALLGGLGAFGAIGLLAGPLIVVFFLTMLRMARREFAGHGGSEVH